ncbi:hypothetical protein FRC03_010918 [Tulasnella sp. 419]|nr:hypothetical protein FRC03_010918 [Tulasnella sp. 419]
MGFGDYEVLCRTVPSYPHCNLFVRQLVENIPGGGNVDLGNAGVGVNAECAIPRIGDGRLGNIGNMIACGLSAIFTAILIVLVSRRSAAVGRIEFRYLLTLYFISTILQLLDTGSLFRQASTALVVITSIHMGVIAAFFWSLIGNAFVSLQLVEDGTMSSLVPFYAFNIAFVGATTYISLDTAFSFTGAFRSNPPGDLNNIALFVLTSIWPLVAALVYLVIIMYVVLGILREKRPLVFFLCSALAFVVAQVVYFVPSRYICEASNAKVDGSLIATILETVSIGLLAWGWTSITEDTWDESPGW